MQIVKIKLPVGFMRVAIESQTEHLQGWWRAGKVYESEMLEHIWQKYSGGTFVDVGSAIGNHTLYFSKCCNCKVLSIEPARASFEHQKRNLVLSGVLDKVILHNAALGESLGRGKVAQLTTSNLGMAQLTKGNEIGIITLDILAKNEGLEDITLIKIDVEGCELSVLKGAKRVLREQQPALFIEVGTMKAEIDDYLKVLGYREKATFNISPTVEYVIEGR